MDSAFDHLETDRLVVRRFVAGDLDAFVRYRNDPEVARYQGWTLPYDRERGVDFLDWLGSHDPDEPGEWYQLAIARRDRPDEPIGDLGFVPDREDPATIEIGFTLARSHQGHGFATEAVGALIGYLFDRLGKHRVTARCDVRNVRSAALLERLGFRCEGELREAQLEADGSRSSVALYALLAGERRTHR